MLKNFRMVPMLQVGCDGIGSSEGVETLALLFHHVVFLEVHVDVAFFTVAASQLKCRYPFF